jgi:hypothetical protein
MVYVTDTESWQRIFQMVSEKSRWDLPNSEVSAYMVRSYEYIVDLFNRFDSAEPYSLDPAGLDALREAKRVRRAAMRTRDEDLVAENARARFGMPVSRLDYSAKLGEPVYPPPARDISS